MQKKLYFLNEEEKKRILNLHESRTKKQYLIIEQASSNLKTKWAIAIGKPANLGGDFGVRTVVIDTENFCKNNKWNPTMTDTDIEKIVLDLVAAMNAGRYDNFYVSLTGRGVTKDAIKKFKSKIEELKTIDNFCTAVNYSEENKLSDEKNILHMFDEISENKSFYNNIQIPLSKLVPEESSQSLNTTTDTSKTGAGTGWADPKFVCVKNIPTLEDAPETKYSKLNKGYYFLDGGYLAQSDYDKGKEYSGSFYCDKLGKIKYKVDEYPTGQKEESKKETAVEKKTGEQEKSYTPPVASGIGRTTSSVSKEIPTLLKQVGVEGTSLTQDAINKLYDKLSKKA
jgi:hypothetical protein